MVVENRHVEHFEKTSPREEAGKFWRRVVTGKAVRGRFGVRGWNYLQLNMPLEIVGPVRGGIL